MEKILENCALKNLPNFGGLQITAQQYSTQGLVQTCYARREFAFADYCPPGHGIWGDSYYYFVKFQNISREAR
jgi:hypothetical protein